MRRFAFIILCFVWLADMAAMVFTFPVMAVDYKTGISFGDQAQFFRAETLDPMDGFPAIMLMEDVELSIRLKQIGRVLYFRNGILASGRRWRRVKFARNFLTVTWLFTRYLLERRLGKGEVLHQKYYESYYGSP